MKRAASRLLLIALLAGVHACGGGAANTTTTEPPVASAAPASQVATTMAPTGNESNASETDSVAVAAAPPPEDSVVAALQGDRIEINRAIQFENSTANIAPDSEEILSRIVAVLAEHDEIRKLRIEGHTDARGSESQNRRLSTARAASVARWLREHGVQAELESEGFGSSRALCSEDNDECHARNRRVEFVVARRQWTSRTANPAATTP